VAVGAGGCEALRVKDLDVCGLGSAACHDEVEAEHHAGSENLDRHLLSPAARVLRALFEIG
jgi:hypothetical protein